MEDVDMSRVTNPLIGDCVSNLRIVRSFNCKFGSCRQEVNVHDFAIHVVRVRFDKTIVATIQDERQM